ncbi:hypothetical protein GJV76_08680 [Myroides sp. BIT-d1]|uniref:Uncharacterized protein n=1 Tax=Myroides albus TaxID=2562892 RepID=A0A6I3LQ14_9FLAO|nr:putative phage abortive infection protein [Myroides albus]MTG98202.1 hypothetical protein [Myroides albus]
MNHKRDKKELLFNIRDKYIITIAYHIFFFGLDSFERQVKTNKHPVTKENLSAKDKGCLKEMVKWLRAFRKVHKDFGDKEPICTMIPNVKLYFNYKPYLGHLSRYGHYYRNLILIVKHVVDNKELGLTYEKKREYLRILRAQLTSHEQFLLFLNWYSGIGTQWEEVGIGGNKFFTDYRMIHNINADVIEDTSFNWEGIIGSKFENRLDFKYLNNRDKELFEVIEGFISTQEKKTE